VIKRALKGLSQELVDIVDRSLNPRHGLINSLTEEPLSADGLHLVHATVTPPTYFRNNAPNKLQTTDAGTGAAFSREGACWAAIGEALERYAASIYWPDQLTVASAIDLGARAIGLDQLIRSGKPLVRIFNANTPRAWVKGKEVVSGREVLVPASMTYLGYAKTDDDEIISQNDSTGLACGQNLGSATLSALCELVERDLFASTWLLSRRPPRLSVADALDRLDVPVQLALRGTRPRLELFYLGCEYNVHVVLCVAMSERGHGVVAAAASPYILKAVEKATCEGLYAWRSGSKYADRKTFAGPEEISAPSDHLLYYIEPNRFAQVRSLFQTDECLSLVEVLVREPGHVTATDVAAQMAQDGIMAAMVDLTTRDVAQFDVKVVRVVAPGLQPLIFGPSCVLAPDQRRLNHWREVWGIRSLDLNPLPHPFP